jgi:hypothetical protein
VDEAADVTETSSRGDQLVDRLARRHVDGCGGHLEPGVEHHLCRGGSVLVVQVGQYDVLAGAHAPGDGLADRACSDYDNDFAHDDLLFC